MAEHPRDHGRRRGGGARAQGTPGRELQVHGSGKLLRWLLERDLVDELNLRIYPVIVGDGMRLFPEQGQSHRLELVDSQTTKSGVVFQTYRPVGRATFGDVGDAAPGRAQGSAAPRAATHSSRSARRSASRAPDPRPSRPSSASMRSRASRIASFFGIRNPCLSTMWIATISPSLIMSRTVLGDLVQDPGGPAGSRDDRYAPPS